MSNLFNEKVRDIKREQLINKRIEKYGPLLANADRRDLRNFQPDNFTFKADLNSIETLYNIGVKYLVSIKPIEEMSIDEMEKILDQVSITDEESRKIKTELHDMFFEKDQIINPFYNAKCLLSIYTYLRNYTNLRRSFFNMKDANRSTIKLARKNAIEYYHNNRTPSNRYKINLYLQICNYYKVQNMVVFSTLLKIMTEAKIQCRDAYTNAGRFVKYN